ncbi:hypothetical protein YC2023_096775 [Brassica napus]
MGIRGAMVARLTPDQKVACSIHVGVEIRKTASMSMAVTRIQLNKGSGPLGYKVGALRESQF